MGDVDDVIADLKIKEGIDGARGDDFLDAAADFVAVEEFVVGDEGKRRPRRIRFSERNFVWRFRKAAARRR